MFFLLYKHTGYGVFDDFPKISDHFPKIFQNCSEARRTFPNIFRELPKMPEDVRRFPKIAEDYRGRPEDVSTIHQQEIIDIFTCKDIISSHVRMSYRFMNLLPLGIPLTFI